LFAVDVSCWPGRWSWWSSRDAGRWSPAPRRAWARCSPASWPGAARTWC